MSNADPPSDPFDFYNRWLVEPIQSTGRTVEDIVGVLNLHPLDLDETAQDGFMRLEHARTAPGRYRVWLENQDIFQCFVEVGRESEVDPPVFFESCLDLDRDYRFTANEILDVGGPCVLVCDRFTDFLAFALGQLLCLRLDPSPVWRSQVTGVVFDGPVETPDGFVNPLGRPFPNGYTTWIGRDSVCIPDWGAAFLTPRARADFIAQCRPSIRSTW